MTAWNPDFRKFEDHEITKAIENALGKGRSVTPSKHTLRSLGNYIGRSLPPNTEIGNFIKECMTSSNEGRTILPDQHGLYLPVLTVMFDARRRRRNSTWARHSRPDRHRRLPIFQPA